MRPGSSLLLFPAWLGAVALVGCGPAPCDVDNPGSCPAGQLCSAEGFCATLPEHELCDGGLEANGDGDGDGDGDQGDGDGDGDDPCGEGAEICADQCVFTNQNPNHCGSCGVVCVDGPCAGGTCQAGPLLTDLTRPWNVIFHDGFVYFSEHGSTGGTGGAVKRFPVENPTAVENLAAGVESPRSLTVSPPNLYFFEMRYQVDDALWQTPLAGPPVDAMLLHDDLDANNGDSDDPGYGLAAAGGYVFYMDYTRLYRRGVESAVIDEVATDTFARGLMADPDYIYWTRSGVVYRLETAFSLSPEPAPQAIANLPDGHTIAYAAAENDTHLFYSSKPTGDEGGIVRVAKDGSTTELLVAKVDPINTANDDDAIAFDMALDDTHLYYVTSREGERVLRVSLLVPGATPELVSEASEPYGVAVDDAFVYWSEHTAGEIRRITKP